MVSRMVGEWVESWAAHLDPKWAVKMAAMTVAMMVERMAGCLVLHWAEMKADCLEELMAVY